MRDVGAERMKVLMLGAVLALAPAVLPGNAFAATAAKEAAKGKEAAREYTPQVGQSGKDVVWVPTPQGLVERMLDMAKLTPQDIHYDLGSGDGRTVITAAKRGTQSYGVEYNPDMVALSKRAATKEGVNAKATFIHGDIFKTDFSKATVLTLYLLPSLNVKLRPTILKMKPGTRVVSHAFDMEDWQADQTDTVDGSRAYLWIVPAQVAGTWRWSAGAAGSREVTLKQQYQKVEGAARSGDKPAELRDVKLDGDRIAFSVHESASVHDDYTGRVNGDAIEGTVKNAAGEAKWSATRLKQ